MNMVGDAGRFAQFSAAQSIPIAAANPGGSGAGAGVGLGAGIAMGQMLANSLKTGSPAPPATAASATETKFCLECGETIPRLARFCPACGKPQSQG
jgi:membrane protease subunit (stomatin/prohibitin family)